MLLKQFFCDHKSIVTSTESKPLDHGFMVATQIKCEKCGKNFPYNPNSNCCHVQHIHAELMRDYWINKYNLRNKNASI